MNKRNLPALALVPFALLGFAACGGDDDDTPDTTVASADTMSTTPGTAASSDTMGASGITIASPSVTLPANVSMPSEADMNAAFEDLQGLLTEEQMSCLQENASASADAMAIMETCGIDPMELAQGMGEG